MLLGSATQLFSLVLPMSPWGFPTFFPSESFITKWLLQWGKTRLEGHKTWEIWGNETGAANRQGSRVLTVILPKELGTSAMVSKT